jgi:hypothetical protein
MANFLNGVTAMACVAIGIFFVRFWRESGDRLFGCLAGAFWIFAVNYAMLGVLPFADECRAYAFALRLVGFVAMLIGIVLMDRELIEHLRSGGSHDNDAAS